MVRDGEDEVVERFPALCLDVHFLQRMIEQHFVGNTPRRRERGIGEVPLLDQAFHAVVPHVLSHAIEQRSSTVEERGRVSMGAQHFGEREQVLGRRTPDDGDSRERRKRRRRCFQRADGAVARRIGIREQRTLGDQRIEVRGE
jgi:hypothetical protein